MAITIITNETVHTVDSLQKELSLELSAIEERIKNLVNSVDDVNIILDEFNLLNDQKKQILMDQQIWQLNKVFAN